MHIIVEMSGMLVEIQVRTSLQHLWAEVSERMADSIDSSIKYGGGSSSIREALDLASSSVASVEELELRIAALREHVSDEDRGELERGLLDLKRDAANMLNKTISIVEAVMKRRP